MNADKPVHNWTKVPLWLVLGAMVVLLPLFGYVTMGHINRQKKDSIRFLVEKGAALIRSFEAGTRSGMMGTRRQDFKLQRLLTETAQQPDIVYLKVTDKTGKILADNDPRKLGMMHGQALDLDQVSQSVKERWRIITSQHSPRVFEVYRRFTPAFSPRPGRMHGGMGMGPDPPGPSPQPAMDQNPEHIIFVGFDMTPIESARKSDLRNTLLMGAGLLLLGMAGIILLFLMQSYRETKASLSRIQAFSDTVVDHLPLGLLATDPRERLLTVNRTAEALLDMNASGIIGKTIKEALPEQLGSHFSNLQAGRTHGPIEIDYTRNDGKRISLELFSTRLNEQDGSDSGQVLLLRDLSEIRSLRQEIAKNQRLATVGRLAAGVAHEIRNPLSSIKGFATYFKERYADNAADTQTATIMIQEVERLNRVVSQLLDFARPVTIKRQEINVARFIAASLERIEHQLKEKAIVVSTRIADDTLAIYADADHLAQVLLNLYLNAIQAMEDGGQLTIIAEPESSGMLLLQIRDTGSGIANEELAHIFDPYFTTKATGTGLGLAIAHNIITAHRGRISVDSRPGQGTTVTIALPLDKEA